MDICDICSERKAPLIIISCIHYACAQCHEDVINTDNKCPVCFQKINDKWPLIYKHDVHCAKLPEDIEKYYADISPYHLHKLNQIIWYGSILLRENDYINPPNRLELYDYIKKIMNKSEKSISRMEENILLYNKQIDILARIGRLDLKDVLHIYIPDIDNELIYGTKIVYICDKWVLHNNHLYPNICIYDIQNSNRYKILETMLLFCDNKSILRTDTCIRCVIIAKLYINVWCNHYKELYRIDKTTNKIIGRYLIDYSYVSNDYYNVDHDNYDNIRNFYTRDRQLVSTDTTSLGISLISGLYALWASPF